MNVMRTDHVFPRIHKDAKGKETEVANSDESDDSDQSDSSDDE